MKVFHDGIPWARVHNINQILGFNGGTLPFCYLGVPIFKGKPKRSQLQPIAEKILAKLIAWKGLTLSYMGRVQLVKSTIECMMLHSCFIYAQPCSLLKFLDSYIQNFIWNGDILKIKMVIVAWKHVRTPIKSGELGLRSFKTLNRVAKLKLCWIFYSTNGVWANLMRTHFHHGQRAVYAQSLVWPGIRDVLHDVHENITWEICDGKILSILEDSPWLNPNR